MLISPDKEKKLRQFLNMLLAKSRTMNLTSVTDTDAAWDRHVIDAMQLCPYVPTLKAKIIDVGTGGGLPGIPLAINYPQHEFILLDGTVKKLRFLEVVVEELQLENVQLCWGRAEEMGRRRDMRDQFDIAVSRAVAPLPVLIELCVPFLKAGGCMLAMKGAKSDEELRLSANALTELNVSIAAVHNLSATGSNESVIVELRKESATPDKYPRRAGIPKKRPL